ncbi:DinB family protein [Kaistella jeonii]|uniref:DNA damage-inducible protein DinB n=1 Tax=Kaistella jeonii TaxID=266749 RepID=A0A0C1CV76_9FLAO|nr:DinB family protein [Kaistella jeonii]KIA88236.1 DNA damage-inducible protein DinB [Kaistella jeonii]SFC26616.1 DinB superfamily protein [Kaistella jeonii]VEI95704.1 metal-dependent hydrolase [Kaistella jeonii]
MTEFQKYIQRYLDLIPSENWLEELKNSADQTLEIYMKLSEEESNFAYAEGKWTLKELLQHLIDAERIFIYRALRFSRNDQTELSGWDEELYAKEYFLDQVSLKNLMEEFDFLRKSNILFFRNLNQEILSRKGIANKNEISVETIGKLIVGHNIHHLNIIRERYLAK